MNPYTYTEELGHYQKQKRRVLRMLFIHILIFDSAFIWTRAGLAKQLTTVIWTGMLIYGCYRFIRFIEKKHHKTQNTMRESHGASKLLYEGVDYYGAWHRTRRKSTVVITMYSLILAIYALVLLYIFFLLYREMDPNGIAPFILTGLHAVLVVPISAPFNYIILPRYHFTDTGIIVNRTFAIPYTQIRKYQWLPQAKAGYFLDLNTGQHFARLIISHLDKPKIEELFKASE